VYAVAHLHGVRWEELDEVFHAKTELLYQRIEQYRLDLAHQRVFVTDLDGCVVDIQPFVDSFEGGKAYGASSTLDRERAVFDWYEAGGFLRLPAMPGAREVLTEAKAQGMLIACVSARPVWQHRRLAYDTQRWLHDNGIPHDILVFDKDKNDALVKHVLPAKVVGFVEDRDKHALELANRGVDVLLVDTPRNRHIAGPTIHRVSTWQDIRNWLVSRNWGR
jgi:hypothetical protein